MSKTEIRIRKFIVIITVIALFVPANLDVTQTYGLDLSHPTGLYLLMNFVLALFMLPFSIPILFLVVTIPLLLSMNVILVKKASHSLKLLYRVFLAIEVIFNWSLFILAGVEWRDFTLLFTMFLIPFCVLMEVYIVVVSILNSVPARRG